MRQQMIEDKGNNEKWKCQISDFKWNINKMKVIYTSIIKIKFILYKINTNEINT